MGRWGSRWVWIGARQVSFTKSHPAARLPGYEFRPDGRPDLADHTQLPGATMSRKIAADCVAQGAKSLDAPVSGRQHRAERQGAHSGGIAESALPITSLVQQMIITLMNEGKGDLDHSGIVNFLEAMAGIEVQKPAAASA
ncbi:MAG: hypothetical protein IT158_13150 [Bryobacterales bacterium]|nr:hypothetical protein [Bryobacterales bacterium]